MNRKSFFALPFAAALLLSAAPAFAHEQQVFRVGGKEYTFVVGSLNEPVFVDDRSGVELHVMHAPVKGEKMMVHDGGEHGAGTPIIGLEKTLRVELIAGDKKRVQDLSPAYSEPGSYKSPFYPTVATTLTYRVFGQLEGQDVDLSFTCNPAGHPQSPEDTTEMKMSETVTRIKKTGAFGCPKSKEDAGFPEPAASLRDLASKAPAAAPAAPSQALPVGLGALGTLLGLAALMKAKK